MREKCIGLTSAFSLCRVLERALGVLATLCGAAQVRGVEGRLQERVCGFVRVSVWAGVCMNMLASEKQNKKIMLGLLLPSGF